MTAIDDLNAIVSTLPGANTVSAVLKNAALAKSQVPDSAGVWPGDAGYVPTYDVFYAASVVASFLSSQSEVTATSSEGSSVTVTPTNWSAVISSFLGMSTIVAARTADVLRVVELPCDPHVRPVPMGGGWGDSDYDTDMG